MEMRSNNAKGEIQNQEESQIQKAEIMRHEEKEEEQRLQKEKQKKEEEESQRQKVNLLAQIERKKKRQELLKKKQEEKGQKEEKRQQEEKKQQEEKGQQEESQKAANKKKELPNKEEENVILPQNYNLLEEQIQGIPPILFGKFIEKRSYTEHEFRRYIDAVEQNANEFLYLFQDYGDDDDDEDEELSKIKEEINELLRTLRGIINELIHESKLCKKVEIIHNFYKNAKIDELRQEMISICYPLVEDIPKTFPEVNEDVNKRELFQDFDPNKNKGEINFDKFKPIETPENYSQLIGKEELLDKYDKFISVTNTIISLRNLSSFESKYDEKLKDIEKNEVLYSKEINEKLKAQIEAEKKRKEDEEKERKRKEAEETQQKLQEDERKRREEEAEHRRCEAETTRKQQEEAERKRREEEAEHRRREAEMVLRGREHELLLSIQQLEDRKKELEGYVKDLENRSIDIEKTIDKDLNDLRKCLKDANQKEQRIESLIQKRQKKAANAILKQRIEQPTTNLNEIYQMSDSEKVAYFNHLVDDRSDNKFNISIQNFTILTQNINDVNERQFEYMIELYNHKRSVGENGYQIIFINLHRIDFPMMQQLLNLEDFSFQYLSGDVIKLFAQKIELYDSLFKDIEQLFISNERIACQNNNDNDDLNERDNFLKKSKKNYYLLYNKIHNEVRIYDGTKSIESHLFDGYVIEKVFIPKSVLSINDNAFYQCKNLTTVSLECIDLRSIGKSAFSGCESLRTFTIPSKVKIIEEFTFKGCKSLEKVIFPASLQEIKDKAFYDCKSLTEIKLPKTIQKVGPGAFKKCKSLRIVIIPGILSIYPYDNEIQVEDRSVPVVSKFVISSKCFSKCNELQFIKIHKNCQIIEDSAFSSCSKIEKIEMNLSNGSKIEKNAFENCEQLKKVSFCVESNVSLDIENSAFQNCIELEKVEFDKQDLLIQNSVRIQSSVFSGCENLTEFNFPPNCDGNIGDHCFNRCINLESVQLPISMTTVSAGLFKNCVKLKKINLSTEITEIESSAFENCANLELHELPQKLLKVGDNAFKKCVLLNVVELPKIIEEIGENAFEGCEKFEQIVIPQSMKIIHKNAFKGCIGLKKLINYSQSIKIKKKAFYKCNNLKEIFSNSKEGFSTEAFDSCAQGLDFFKIEKKK